MALVQGRDFTSEDAGRLARAELRSGGQAHHLALIPLIITGHGKGQGIGDGGQHGV